MCDTLRQEVLSVRCGDNRTFLPGRRDHVVSYVSNTGCECQSHNTLGDLGTFRCWVPNSSLEMSHGEQSPLEPTRAPCVVCKPTETRHGHVHQYQRQTKAEQQHCMENIDVENIKLAATGTSPLFILSLETAKIAVTSLISFPRYVVHK